MTSSTIEYQVLQALKDRKEHQKVDIFEYIEASNATLYTETAKMKKNGYVSFHPFLSDASGILMITDAGYKHLSKLEEQAKQQQQEKLHGFEYFRKVQWVNFVRGDKLIPTLIGIIGAILGFFIGRI
ncbi:hypothetical protein H6771_01180 [Candidatus Peribacteria bacterium]|nr:hypothetical protein [Candidatus Peribacteria bacterium]